jgi:hypothetical protein
MCPTNRVGPALHVDSCASTRLKFDSSLRISTEYTGPWVLAQQGVLFGMPKSLTKVASLVLSLQSLVAFVLVAAPRSPIPLRAGANEVLLYFLVFLYFAAVGGRIWSLDFMIQKCRAAAPASELNQFG